MTHHLSAAVATYGHTEALKRHEVEPDGFHLDFVEVDPIIAAFRRMIRSLEFDICELAPTTYLVAREAKIPITALPIFLMRRFHHGDIVCRPGSGIREPKDLEGRRAGVRAYTVSTGVWARGVLGSQYDVDLDSMTWVVDDEEHVTSFRLPQNVVKLPEGESVVGAFRSGGIDVALTGPAGIGRSGPPTAGWDQTGEQQAQSFYTLFDDSSAREAQWYRATGIYPLHALIALKSEVASRHSEFPEALMGAFRQSKEAFLARLAEPGETPKNGDHYRAMQAIVGHDPLPFGIEANEASLEALLRFARDQHIIGRVPPLHELFLDV